MRRRSILWLLLLALPVYGCAGVIVGLLGKSHVHRPTSHVAIGTEILQDFRRQMGDMRENSRPHGHGLWQRHHHAVDDRTVAALEGDAQGSLPNEGVSSFVSLCAMGQVPTGMAVLPAVAGLRRWPCAGADAVATRAAVPLERPPKA